MRPTEKIPASESSAPATKRVAGLILAAGRASRMGADKRLARIGGRSMLELAIGAAQGAGLDPVLVISGPEPLPDLPSGVRVVINAEPGRGMASSLVAGLEALPEGASGVVVLLADMPRVGAEHVALLVDEAGPDRICVPVHQGRRGNPVLLGRDFFAEIRSLSGDKGAKGVLAAHPQAVREVAMPDDAILIDVDTPEDLRAVGGNA